MRALEERGSSGYRGRSEGVLPLRKFFVVIASVVGSAAFLGVVVPTRAASVQRGRTPVVPSLDPAATTALWDRLAHGHRRVAGPATTDCRPLRLIFYAQTDWLRLATTLAANASPCTQHFISVAPLVADKTQERSDQAWRIRGPRFELPCPGRDQHVRLAQLGDGGRLVVPGRA
jgi:hypothetical protein